MAGIEKQINHLHNLTQEQLIEIIVKQAEIIEELRDEIARLKGLKPRPKIKPSQLEKHGSDQNKGQQGEKRPGSAKREKTKDLEIHQTEIIAPQAFVPEGSRFRGYKEFVVQDLLIKAHNTLYRLERWERPDGSYVQGELPVALGGLHFGAILRGFILYQHHQCRVTQPLLLEQLEEFGIDISAGELDRILNDGKDPFHEEKENILRAGLEVSRHVSVDDTGARHQGKNGFCTHIGNDMFAWFESTESKSRLNFIELLRSGLGKTSGYLIDDAALRFMRDHGIKRAPLLLELCYVDKSFDSLDQWVAHLRRLGITDERSVGVATEAALLSYLLENGLNPRLAIISDDAGQFNILAHGLCWIHAERTLTKLIAVTDDQRAQVEKSRDRIWKFYRSLKAYKVRPSSRKKARLEKRFDKIFKTKTGYISLNEALARLYDNKAELLLVLDRPEIPLHTNCSERDIREYVTRRKISGGTRSDPGRRSRDTFASLKKTCRKLNVSFWGYLLDRLRGENLIAPIPALLRQKALNSLA